MPPKNEVAKAVRELRKTMGLSQQRFSDKIGVTLRTVAHYENDRPPEDKKLIGLYYLATECGRYDLANIFANAHFPDEQKRVAESVTELYFELSVLRGGLEEGTHVKDDDLERLQFLCFLAYPPLEKMIADANAAGGLNKVVEEFWAREELKYRKEKINDLPHRPPPPEER